MAYMKTYFDFMSIMLMANLGKGRFVRNCSSDATKCHDVVEPEMTCRCFVDAKCHWIVTCQLTDTSHLEDLYNSSLVYSLDLSRNSLATIQEKSFTAFEGITFLTLSYNKIKYIQRDVFQGLRRLKMLDLSFNQLHRWDTMGIEKQLLSLRELDVTGNPRWMPTRNVPDLPNIRVIKGIVSHTIRYTENCVFCELFKSKDKDLYLNESYVQNECLKVAFHFHGNIPEWGMKNFTMRCRTESYDNRICQDQRQLTLETTRYSVSATDVCWPSVIKWTTLNIPLSLFAIVINAVVMTTISLSPVLKKNITLYLVGNIALGDCCQGLYLLILTLTRRVISSSFQFYEFKKPCFCFLMIVLYFSAHFFSVLVCFLVSVERFLCVVYSTKPNVRITSRVAKVLLLIVWLLIFCAIAIPYVLEMKISTFDDYTCVYIEVRRKYNYVAYLGSVGIIFYSFSFILYAHVYYTVRKSSTNMGIQREGRLAKRIMIMISTNVLFFLFPIIVSFTEESGLTNFLTKNIVHLYVYLNTFVFLCFVLNSCLNPFLYAFWNEKFRAELTRMLRISSAAVAEGDDAPQRNLNDVPLTVRSTICTDRNSPPNVEKSSLSMIDLGEGNVNRGREG